MHLVIRLLSHHTKECNEGTLYLSFNDVTMCFLMKDSFCTFIFWRALLSAPWSVLCPVFAPPRTFLLNYLKMSSRLWTFAYKRVERMLG